MKHAHRTDRGQATLACAAPSVSVWLVMCLSALLCSIAHPQCVPTWLPGDGVPGIVGGDVNALATYDDGTGPKLYAAGGFNVAGSVNASRIAAWNGSEWQTLGTGLNNSCFGLAVFQGKLYAAGAFSQAGNVNRPNIATWDGTNWATVPGATFAGNGARLESLTVVDNELIACGYFTTVNGITCNNIAAFNGTTWRSFGTGMTNSGGQSSVRSVAVFNNDLYATGRFDAAGGVPANSIAKWNGTTWAPLTSGLNSFGGVCLRAFGNDLFVGGLFTTAGGINSLGVAKWNGSAWAATATPSLNGAVYSFGTQGGQLYCAGQFSSANANYGFLRWNGAAWENTGTQFASLVWVLGNYGGELIAGGAFTGVNGLDCNNIARFSGTLPWRGFGEGFNQSVRAIISRPDELIIAGAFTTVDSRIARNIVKWNGSVWSDVGAGGLPTPSGAIEAIAEYAGSLYAGGSFQNVNDPTKPARFARFDGTNWVKVGTAFLSGSSQIIRALAVYDNKLVIGGQFNNLLGNPASTNIVTWNGTTYAPVGTGIAGSVNALAVHNNELYAAGSLDTAGGVPVVNIAKWSGSAWSAVGAGFDNAVFTLFVWNGQLYAGGRFGASGTTPMVGLARLNGSQWEAVGGSLTTGSCGALGEYNGSLVVMGEFSKVVAPDTFSRIALWSGSAWSGFGSGLSVGNGGGAVGVLNGELYIGSGSLSAGGQISAYLAHWGSLEPCIQSDPVPGSICRGGDFTFNVAATGKPALHYQWRLNNQDILNANGPSYTVTNASEDDEGIYDCFIMNDFGDATSEGASLQLCDADVDCSGMVDDADFIIFVSAYNILDCADPAMPLDCPSDFNRDAVVDDSDFGVFVVAYNELVCP